MNTSARLWLLLFIVFTTVFAVFVNHDLLLVAEDRMIVKQKASPLEVAGASAIAGFLLSSLTVSLHAVGEQLWGRDHSRPPTVG